MTEPDSDIIEGPKGRYRVTTTQSGQETHWRVMEAFGSFRMLKKRFGTRDAAERRAREMAGLEP